MKKRKICQIAIVACMACLSATAQRSLSGSIMPSETVQSVITFTLTSNSSPTITFSNGSDYTDGYVVLSFNTIAVQSNMPWNLYISSSTDNFTNSGVYSTPNTPASLLIYGVEGKSTKMTLSSTPKLLIAGPRGSYDKLGNTFDISLSIDPGYSYGPGTYTISTVYTISAQ